MGSSPIAHPIQYRAFQNFFLKRFFCANRPHCGSSRQGRLQTLSLRSELSAISLIPLEVPVGFEYMWSKRNFPCWKSCFFRLCFRAGQLVRPDVFFIP
ncbi:MAG: hypothetical protein D3904_04525 [Candidatus Electrothrix sp. EH2]|nr:hypothetical protein [Candidatus Electrothrix sp. EH2]